MSTSTASLPGTEAARINLRASPEAKALIERAAALLGTTVSAFMLQHAYEAARQVVAIGPGPEREALGRGVGQVKDGAVKEAVASRGLLRVPHGVDARAQPYLVTAWILAGMHLGIAESGRLAPSDPAPLDHALAILEASDVAAAYLGRPFRDLYVAHRRRIGSTR